MTDGQQLALTQLREVEASGDGSLEIVAIREEGEFIIAEVSVRTSGLARVEEGLPLRDRERLILQIPPDFPFEHPQIETPHSRFADFPHVQWKRHLCLYQAPNTEWDASDGIFGFLIRLDEWLHRGALNELDPIGAPCTRPLPMRDRASS